MAYDLMDGATHPKPSIGPKLAPTLLLSSDRSIGLFFARKELDLYRIHRREASFDAHGMQLCNLNRTDSHANFSIAYVQPSGSLQVIARLCIVGPVNVGWEAADHDGRAEIAAVPSGGVEPRLAELVRHYGVGSYKIHLPLNVLFSQAGIKGLFLERLDRPPRRSTFKARLKFIETWNSKPAGKGPFDHFLYANARAWKAFGYPPKIANLKLDPSSLPQSILQRILSALSPDSTLSDMSRIFSTTSRTLPHPSDSTPSRLGVQFLLWPIQKGMRASYLRANFAGLF